MGPELLLGRELGAGRTARVFAATLTAPWGDLPEGTTVAVKVLRSELAADEDARCALRTEADASRTIRHSALGRVRHLEMEAGTALPREQGAGPAPDPAPWMVLDLVDGPTLLDPGAAHGALPEPTVRSIGARVAGALGAIHASGWTHGDVKPDNILVNSSGRAVLVDLGFARRAGSSNAPLGTPAYLSPERARGQSPRAADDLFALGCVLYELVVGAPAVGDPPDLDRLREGRLRPPSEQVPRVSPLLDALILALLSPSGSARPTASEVEAACRDGEASEWWRARIEFDAAARRDTVAHSGHHALPLVGRDSELARLEAAWAETESGGHAVVLTGVQGSGKSRLVAEFAHRVRRTGDVPPLFLYGRCDPMGDERPGAPLIALLHRWLHLPPGAVPRERSRALLESTLPPDVAQTLISILDPDADGAAISESIALGEWILNLTSGDDPKGTGAAIVFLDDVNFAGAATLAALIHVARHLDRRRLLLVLGIRSRSGQLQPSELAELRSRLAPRTARIDLGPLDEPAVLALVERLFHHSVPRLRLARVLHERTEGVPGTIGEVLRICAQRGWTRKRPGPDARLDLLVAPDELPRPESVRRAVASRLAGLDGPSRIWLERAAVVGSRFHPRFLRRAWSSSSNTRLTASLARLVGDEMLVSAGGVYRFAHPIEREETLSRMSERRQRRAHGAVAEELRNAELRSGRGPSHSRARHLRSAGQNAELLSILPELIERTQRGGHPARRATLAGWGLEAIDELPGDEVEDGLRRQLLEALADAAGRLGEREAQRDALDALSDLDVDLAAEPGVGARVYLLHARHALMGGGYGLARGFLRNAAALGERAHAALGGGADLSLAADRAEIERLLGRIDLDLGAYGNASRHISRALQLTPTGVPAARARLLEAEVQLLEGRTEEALRLLAGARRELRADVASLDGLAARAATSLLTGRAWRLLGRPYRAARALERAAELAVQAGEGRIEVEVEARRGRLLADVKREHAAELRLRDALFTARRIEDPRGEALTSLFLGTLLGETGSEGARDLIVRARVLAADLGLARTEALARAVEARVAREAGDVPQALEASKEAWALVGSNGAELVDRIVIGATRALVLQEFGRSAEGDKILRNLRRKLEVDNSRIRSTLTKARHRRYTVALLASASSASGPLYPRVALADWPR